MSNTQTQIHLPRYSKKIDALIFQIKAACLKSEGMSIKWDKFLDTLSVCADAYHVLGRDGNASSSFEEGFKLAEMAKGRDIWCYVDEFSAYYFIGEEEEALNRIRQIAKKRKIKLKIKRLTRQAKPRI
jgi:hypothetical protein